eukprot:scaffold4215_cov128-Skeletonema_dohrnii-CCMP3373.AAC.2
MAIGRGISNPIDPNGVATDERMAHAAVAEYLGSISVELIENLLHKNGDDMASLYNAHHNVTFPEDFNQLLSDDMCVPNRVRHIAAKLEQFFPLMTISFWREHDMEEAKRRINKQVKIRTEAAKQEKAQGDVEQALEAQADGDQPQAATIEAIEQPVKSWIQEAVNANEQKKKQRARKKSSGKPAKKNQTGKPTSSGQSNSNKSKGKLSTTQQNLKELLKQQQDGSKPKGNGTVRSGGGGRGRGGRGGQSGRGRGNQGGSNNGGRGKGKGKGGAGGKK